MNTYESYTKVFKCLYLADTSRVMIPVIADEFIEKLKTDFDAELYQELNNKLKFDTAYKLKNSDILVVGGADMSNIGLIFNESDLNEYMSTSHYIPLKGQQINYEYKPRLIDKNNIADLVDESILHIAKLFDLPPKNLNLSPESLSIINAELTKSLPSSYLFDELSLWLSVYYGEILRRKIDGEWEVFVQDV